MFLVRSRAAGFRRFFGDRGVCFVRLGLGLRAPTCDGDSASSTASSDQHFTKSESRHRVRTRLLRKKTLYEVVWRIDACGQDASGPLSDPLDLVSAPYAEILEPLIRNSYASTEEREQASCYRSIRCERKRVGSNATHRVPGDGGRRASVPGQRPLPAPALVRFRGTKDRGLNQYDSRM